MKLVSICNVSKVYHTKEKEVIALDNVSFDINEGEIVSIVGSSGCGKSTLLNLITKLENPTSGEIIDNKKLVIGYMMQNDALLPWLTVWENACLGLKLKHIKDKSYYKYVEELLSKYGLIEFKDLYPDSLSGGMRQRVV